MMLGAIPVFCDIDPETLTVNENLIAKMISKNSKTQVIIVKSQKELSNYLRRNLISDEIIIGMGAGSVSQWMRELKFSL